jgi:hypothetical protein
LTCPPRPLVHPDCSAARHRDTWETAFRKGGLKDIAVKHVGGELRFKSAQEYWCFMTEVSAPVVAGLTKADEPTRKKIEATVLDLAGKTSPDGKPCLTWSASTITGSK